jgi:hypothetical protein
VVGPRYISNEQVEQRPDVPQEVLDVGLEVTVVDGEQAQCRLAENNPSHGVERADRIHRCNQVVPVDVEFLRRLVQVLRRFHVEDHVERGLYWHEDLLDVGRAYGRTQAVPTAGDRNP